MLEDTVCVCVCTHSCSVRIKHIICSGENTQIFNIFYDVNDFYVFRQELLHSPNKLAAENGRNINGNTYVKL